MVFIKTRRRLYPSLFEIEHQGGSLPPHSRLKGHGVTLYNSPALGLGGEHESIPD